MPRIKALIVIFGVTAIMGQQLQQENLKCLYYTTYTNQRYEFCYNEDRSVFINRELTEDMGFLITDPTGDLTQ